MNARPLLLRIIHALDSSGLEAIMIGNSAAAIHGAPVTTLDFDFMFRDTPGNRAKLKKFAKAVGAVVFRPYYPVSALFRVIDDNSGLQVDFMPRMHGIKSFVSLRSRSEILKIGKATVRVACLADIIKSKKAAGRLSDRSVLPLLEATLREKEKEEE